MFFPPIDPPSLYPSLYCLYPCVMHICIWVPQLITSLPFPHPDFPSGMFQSVPCFSVSGSILFIINWSQPYNALFAVKTVYSWDVRVECNHLCFWEQALLGEGTYFIVMQGNVCSQEGESLCTRANMYRCIILWSIHANVDISQVGVAKCPRGIEGLPLNEEVWKRGLYNLGAEGSHHLQIFGELSWR